MGAYKFQVQFGAMNYLAMFPSFVLAPWLWAKVFMVDYETAMTAEATKSIQGIFLCLLVVVTPSYVMALNDKNALFIDVSVVQRCTVVFLGVIITALIGQDPFPGYNMCLVMTAVDIGGGFAHAFSHPKGFFGAFKGVYALFKNTPINAHNKALRVEAYVGMTFGGMACIYAAIVSDVKMSIMMTLVSTFVFYLWVWFNAVDLSETCWKTLSSHRVLVAASLLFMSEVYDFGVMNIVFRLMAVNLLLAIGSPYFGAISSGVGTLVLYKMACDFVLTVDKGGFYWCSLWGVLTVISSYVWIWLFYDGYDEKQKKRVMGTHWQDKILAIFLCVSAGGMERAGFGGPGTVGTPIVYLLPFVTMWFTLETKMLNHIQSGTPFHPSWYCEGDLQEYSKNDWVNMTFSVGTALITVVLTTYAYYAISTAVGSSSLGFGTENTFNFMLIHGMVFIFHSGLWMIFASSGVPAMGNRPMFRVFPPELPPAIRCRPHNCIPVHKVDLATGAICMFFGVFFCDDGANLTQNKMFKIAVGLGWAYSVFAKVRLHIQDYGYIPSTPHTSTYIQDVKKKGE